VNELLGKNLYAIEQQIGGVKLGWEVGIGHSTKGPKPMKHDSKCLEALAVDNGRSGFIILFLGDPHALEG
jgi:hypothetical protein